MPVAPMATPPPARPNAGRRSHLKTLHRRTYPLRTLGMGLACLPVSAAIWELHSPPAAWAWMLFSCLLWPHLAYLLARNRHDPLRAELGNFVFDSFVAASWLPLMHFNALPSAVLLSVVMADKINTGVRGLWLRSLPGMIVALLVGGALTGFAFQPQTSMIVLLASLPILIIHTLAVSLVSYRLVRKVQKQNLLLEQLSREDALTGLASRGHWQNLAEQLLQRHLAEGCHATVMLLDVDEFKTINDRHGHAAGDGVLRGIADLIRTHLSAECHAGRLGGDEFAVALPLSLAEAEAAAERIRLAVETLHFPHAPELRCSISIGIAKPDRELGLRDWVEMADRALYRAKHAGRNRTEGRQVTMPLEALARE